MNTSFVHKVKWYKDDLRCIPYHILSVQTPWRKLSKITHKFRENDIDIRKAYIQPESSVLYLKESKDRILSRHHRNYITSLIEDVYQQDDDVVDTNNILLPETTEIHLYNVPKTNYTTLEFSCQDRLGLLTDMINLIASFPYEMKRAYISSVGSYAHNIFLLNHRDKPLDYKEVQYISNVFEYEVKERSYHVDIQETSI
jgi:UTP:GlnB (protein PII) uridylyltransferase